MNIYSIYRHFQPYFRRKRWKHFLDLFSPTKDTHLLDIGGHPGEWMSSVEVPLTVTVLNVGPWPKELNAPSRFIYVEGDARGMSFVDGSFEIAYSNSVIEHMGGWAEQKKFADEARRVGRSLYVQTPNRWFPIEPHFVAFFVHWLPTRMRDALMPWFSVRGWFRKGDDVEMQTLLNEVRLLTFQEMQTLFPDCEIHREKVLGLTKSLIAVRKR